jgi:hypothetical protein
MTRTLKNTVKAIFENKFLLPALLGLVAMFLLLTFGLPAIMFLVIASLICVASF